MYKNPDLSRHTTEELRGASDFDLAVGAALSTSYASALRIHQEARRRAAVFEEHHDYGAGRDHLDKLLMASERAMTRCKYGVSQSGRQLSDARSAAQALMNILNGGE